MKTMSRNNFTIVELLVVISIIMILASLLFPALKKSRDTAKAIVCAGNLKQVGQLQQLYATDFNGWATPAMVTLQGTSWAGIILTQGYIKSPAVGKPSVFLCPTGLTPKGNGLWEDDTYTYGMRLLLDYGPWRIGAGAIVNPYNTSYDFDPPSKFIHFMDCFFRDTSRSDAPYNMQRYAFFPYTMASESCAKVQLRHSKKANALFGDNHVSAFNRSELRGKSPGYNGSSYLYGFGDCATE